MVIHKHSILWWPHLDKKGLEYLENSEDFKCKKSYNGRNQREEYFHAYLTFRALLQRFFINPKITIFDTYGEAAIWMWILLRLFRPDTKIVTIFHHYEPYFVRHNKGGTSVENIAVYSICLPK